MKYILYAYNSCKKYQYINMSIYCLIKILDCIDVYDNSECFVNRYASYGIFTYNVLVIIIEK